MLTDSYKKRFGNATGYLLIFIFWLVIAEFNRTIAGKPFPYPWEAAAAGLCAGFLMGISRRLEETAVLPLTLEGRSFPIILAASRKFVERYPDLVEMILTEFRKPQDFSTDSIKLISSVTGLEDEILKRSMALHDYGFRTISVYTDELEQLAVFLSDSGRIPAVPDWTEVIR